MQKDTDPPARESFVPPPSQLGGLGFTAFADTAVLDHGAGSVQEEDDGWPDLPEESAEPVSGAAAPRLPRPAQSVNWRDFDDMVRGLDPDGTESLPPLDLEPEYGRLAAASLAVSLSGIVTGVGFLVGTVMGQVALHRIGRAGWFERNESARRQARNAVMIGCIGMAVLATGALLVTGWWFMQTPLDELMPGMNADTAPVTTTNEATP